MRNATDQEFDDKYTGMDRANGVVFELNGKVYITLGTSGSFNKSTWEYEPIADRWIQKAAFEGSARSDAVAFTLYDGTKQRAFVATGGSSTSRYDDVWEFKPSEETDENDNGSGN
jgi:N-acetylneuraminic acid mutarotase